MKKLNFLIWGFDAFPFHDLDVVQAWFFIGLIKLFACGSIWFILEANLEQNTCFIMSACLCCCVYSLFHSFCFFPL